MFKGKIFAEDGRKNPTYAEVNRACAGYHDGETIGFPVRLSPLSEEIVQIELRVFQIEYSILTEGVVPFNGDLVLPIDGHTKFIAYYNPQTGTGCITLLKNNERQ